MATLVVGSVTFKALIDGAQGTADRYWLRAPYGSQEYRTERIKAPAQTGSKLKRHGFTSRSGTFEVLYVQASAAAAKTARANDEAAFLNTNVEIVIPDGPTLTNCEIGAGEVLDGPRICETGNYLLRMRYRFEEVRLA
jgi:hypothetical protein